MQAGTPDYLQGKHHRKIRKNSSSGFLICEDAKKQGFALLSILLVTESTYPVRRPESPRRTNRRTVQFAFFVASY